MEYCTKWELEINACNTKVMVLSTGGVNTKYLTYKGATLESVNSHKYLGSMFTNNGYIRKMELDRVDKAK